MEYIGSIPLVIRHQFTDGRDHIPAGELVQVLNSVIEASYLTEQRDLFAAIREVSDIDHETYEQASEKLKSQYKYDSLRLESASDGSIIVAGAFAGLATWLIANTLGISFQEAWQESQANFKFKHFIQNTLLPKRTEMAANDIRIKLEKAKINSLVSVQNEGIEIVVNPNVDQRPLRDLNPRPFSPSGTRRLRIR